MFDQEAFKDMLSEKGIHAYELANALDIQDATLSRKIHGNTNWRLWEIQGIKDFCKLTDEELIRIFFYKGESDK